MTRLGRFALCVSLVLFCFGVASGAEQLKPTKGLVVKNPPAGAQKRKIVWNVVEKASSNTVVGDPTVNGAQVNIELDPGGTQCFQMPAAGWKAIKTFGFKYKDTKLAQGAVKVAQIKKTKKGDFILKLVILGKGATPINVAPGNPTTTYGVNFEINGGDEYCSGTGTATPKKNKTKIFKVVKDTEPATCPLLPCSA
jgi:hypothetical protein